MFFEVGRNIEFYGLQRVFAVRALNLRRVRLRRARYAFAAGIFTPALRCVSPPGARVRLQGRLDFAGAVGNVGWRGVAPDADSPACVRRRRPQVRWLRLWATLCSTHSRETGHRATPIPAIASDAPAWPGAWMALLIAGLGATPSGLCRA